MKKPIMLLSTLFLSLTVAGSALAADIKKDTKIDLTGILDSHSVSVSNYKYDGVSMPAELIDGSLYLKADNSLPLLTTWGYFPDENFSHAGFNEDGKTDVAVMLGSKTFIDFQGKPQPLTDTMKAQLKRGYFPARFVYELAGFQVDYDQDTHSVLIHY